MLDFLFNFWALRAVTVNSTVFWVVTPYSLEKARSTEGIYHLNLHGRRVSQAKKISKASNCYPEDGGDMFPKRQAMYDLHGITAQGTVLFVGCLVPFISVFPGSKDKR
jgi:hypothetical protein